MRLILFLAVCLIASTAMADVTYDPSINVSLSPSVSNVSVGQEFSLSFVLQATQPIVNDDDFHAQILLNFDPTTLQLLGAQDPASIAPYELFPGVSFPEYVWQAPGPVTLSVGQTLTLPAMQFLAIGQTPLTEIDISGLTPGEYGSQAVKHDCDVDYTNQMTGAEVSVGPAVPEPITLVAAMMGISGLGLYVRRRSRSAMKEEVKS